MSLDPGGRKPIRHDEYSRPVRLRQARGLRSVRLRQARGFALRKTASKVRAQQIRPSIRRCAGHDHRRQPGRLEASLQRWQIEIRVHGIPGGGVSGLEG